MSNGILDRCADRGVRPRQATGAYDVEYCETDSGLVNYVLQREGTVLPFVLSYHPYTEDAERVAVEFDPDTGQHAKILYCVYPVVSAGFEKFLLFTPPLPS